MTEAPYTPWRGLWHAGLAPALYSAGITGALLQLTGLWVNDSPTRVALALSAALVSAFGMMLLDRVKWRDAQLDPADEAADSRQAAFIRANTRFWRTIVVLCALAGASLAWFTAGPIAIACVLLGYAAIGLYAGLPGDGRPSALRLKDIPVVKNVFVALGLVGLSTVIVLGRDPGALRSPSVVMVIAFLVCIVTGDAVLCDLPDERSDRAFGARTLPVLIGPRRASTMAIGVIALAGAALLIASPANNARITALWAIAPPASAALALRARPGAIKTLIDLRPACVALAGALILLA